MKTTRFILALTLGTLALTGCTNEDEIQNNVLPDGAVHITGNIAGVTTRADINDDGTGTFTTGDVWGMYTTVDGTTYINDNSEYKYDETVLYWDALSTTAPVTFAAHYPRITETISNPAAYMYKPYEWSNIGDLLHATATASKGGGTVALTFKHLMHRLVVNLTAGAVMTAGAGMTGTDLSSADVSTVARNGDFTMIHGVEVNLLTGAVNYDNTEGHIGFTNRGSGNADWQVAPQDLTAGAEWLKITVGEDVWYYNVPADLNTTEPGNQTRLESGKQLTLNLTLKKTSAGGNEVVLTSSAIDGWNNQGTITDDVTIGGGGTPATITAEQVKTALTGTGTEPIVIDGDLTLALDANLRLGADHTLTINPGATLTINGYAINCSDHTLTVGGGGTLLIDEGHVTNPGIVYGTLKLEGVTVELKDGWINDCDIEVGTAATIVVNSQVFIPIQMVSKTLTLKGKIQIKNFYHRGILSYGKLLIDGGSISIDGLGIEAAPGFTPHAIEMAGNASTLEITNNGILTSTVDGGVVYLYSDSKVKGANGLFRTDYYTLDTDEEVQVGSGGIDALADGVYKWDAANSIFVWAVD